MEKAELKKAYEKAEYLMPWKLEDAVLNGAPELVWMTDHTFFYSRQTRVAEKIRTDFIGQDAVTGQEWSLFDADEVANLMGHEQLPFRQADYREGMLEFTADGYRWRYDLEQKKLEKLEWEEQDTSVVSPDGKKEIFVKDYNLYLRDKRTGRTEQLTFDGEKDFAYGAEAEQINVVRERQAGISPVAGVLWSHNSEMFLTYKLDMRGVKEFYILKSFDREGKESIRPELISYHCSLPEDDRVPLAYFYIYHLDTKKKYQVEGPPVAASHFILNKKYEMAVWLEDDSCIYYTSTTRGDKKGFFHVVDAANGHTRTVIAEEAEKFLNLGTYGRYDGFGAYPYSNFLTADKRYVFWQSERSGKARMYRFDAQTGELLNPVTPEDSIAGVLKLKDEEGQWLYYMANALSLSTDPYYHYLCRVHFDGSGFQILTPEDGEHEVRIYGQYFADTWSRVDKPPVTVLRKLDGTLVKTLEEADVEKLLELGYQIPQRFTVTASDGKTPLYGILIPPANLEEGREYPVIDYAYGGMQCCNVPKAFTWKVEGGREIFGGLQSFAQVGFAGFILDGLGTPGRGMEIHGVSYENIHGCAGLWDHIAVREQLKEQFPFLDWSRAGIWGNSGGAYAAVRAMLEYPGTYQVGVASAGNHDQRMYDNMWTERYYGLYNPEIYKKGDNTALASRLEGKLFIVHGAMDCNVAFSQSVRLVDALIREDKDFDFLILPRTNHNVPGNPYFIRKKLDYFVRYLLKEEPPADYHFSVSNLLDQTFS